MGPALRELSELITFIHRFLTKMFQALGFQFSDKQLHFIIIGIAGFIIFILSTLLFKWLAKYSIQFVSLIFTLTVLVVVVFAIEIQQKISGSGNMEFADVVYGLWGFLAIFAIYLVGYGIYKLIKKQLT
ncbi:MAG: hypothetical protein GX775_02430 [Erysipelothrix sp.]|nr:hypothetical protein [Erysipelothrix sp.]